MSVVSRNMRLLALTALLAATAGCQWAAPRTAAGDVDVDAADKETLKQEYVKLRDHSQELEAQLAARELELAKRDADVKSQVELNRLLRQELELSSADLTYLESQFITLEHRLTGEESRASAVAAIADAQLLLEKFEGRQDSTVATEVILEARQKLSAADDQMKRNNYPAAVYYANRALRGLNQSERRHNAFFASGTTRIVSVSLANVRQGPGEAFEVVTQLPYGTILVEVREEKDWRMIKARDGVKGWIHASLLY